MLLVTSCGAKVSMLTRGECKVEIQRCVINVREFVSVSQMLQLMMVEAPMLNRGVPSTSSPGALLLLLMMLMPCRDQGSSEARSSTSRVARGLL